MSDRENIVELVLGNLKWVTMAAVAFLGSIPELTYFLLILMAIDTLFGMAAAIKQRKLSSTAAWSAATKKIGSLGIIVLAAVIDTYIDLLGIDLVQVATVFYIGPELVSILRNAAILEVPVPPQFVSVLRYFQDKDNANTNKP